MLENAVENSLDEFFHVGMGMVILGEIMGEKAVNCPKYDHQYIYRVQCSMVVRGWNSQSTGEVMQATTIYIDRINMV